MAKREITATYIVDDENERETLEALQAIPHESLNIIARSLDAFTLGELIIQMGILRDEMNWIPDAVTNTSTLLSRYETLFFAEGVLRSEIIDYLLDEGQTASSFKSALVGLAFDLKIARSQIRDKVIRGFDNRSFEILRQVAVRCYVEGVQKPSRENGVEYKPITIFDVLNKLDEESDTNVANRATTFLEDNYALFTEKDGTLETSVIEIILRLKNRDAILIALEQTLSAKGVLEVNPHSLGDRSVQMLKEVLKRLVDVRQKKAPVKEQELVATIDFSSLFSYILTYARTNDGMKLYSRAQYFLQLNYQLFFTEDGIIRPEIKRAFINMPDISLGQFKMIVKSVKGVDLKEPRAFGDGTFDFLVEAIRDFNKQNAQSN